MKPAALQHVKLEGAQNMNCPRLDVLGGMSRLGLGEPLP